MIGRELPNYNKSLGDRRATTVKEYLIELGCEANRIEVISLGDELAIPDADSRAVPIGSDEPLLWSPKES